MGTDMVQVSIPFGAETETFQEQVETKERRGGGGGGVGAPDRMVNIEKGVSVQFSFPWSECTGDKSIEQIILKFIF